MKKDTSKATQASIVVRRERAEEKTAERLRESGWTVIPGHYVRTPQFPSSRVESVYRQDGEEVSPAVRIVDAAGQVLVTTTPQDARQLAYRLLRAATDIEIVGAIQEAAERGERLSVEETNKIVDQNEWESLAGAYAKY